MPSSSATEPGAPVSGGSVPPLDQLFPFPLDDFQLEAIDALNQGHSVVVSAPTGSGKTLVGEYAIHRALAHGQKVFYTTPLKALSNQKLRDFREQFGAERVGLMTGDLTVNREASIVVMTTEIFRNMLYAEADSGDDPLADVEAVVLDECHYMNDSQRGTVWEESIIHCPPSVQLVALSATVANAGQLTDWIERVHGPTRLVLSDFRPVPLQFSFCSAKGLHPLLNDEGTGLHPNCKVWRAPKGNKRKGPKTPKPPQPEAPPLGFVIAQMAEREMLPAINANGMGLLPYFPLASGLLTGKYSRNTLPPADTRFAAWQRLGDRYTTGVNWDAVEHVQAFCAARGKTTLELAFNWLLSKSAVSSVIAGATKPEQLEQNVKAGDVLEVEISGIGTLRSHVVDEK